LACLGSTALAALGLSACSASGASTSGTSASSAPTPVPRYFPQGLKSANAEITPTNYEFNLSGSGNYINFTTTAITGEKYQPGSTGPSSTGGYSAYTGCPGPGTAQRVKDANGRPINAKITVGKGCGSSKTYVITPVP
jgi:hypothetical protein